MSACSAIATFLAARNRPRISIESETSSISTVAVRVTRSVRSTSKSSGVSRTGVPEPPRVIAFCSDGRADVEVERVAELVGLVLVRALVAEAGALDLVAARRGPAAGA